MTITGADLLTSLGIMLHDEDSELWTSTLRVQLVNETLTTIALVRPDACAITETLALVASTPKQTIPATGYRLLNVLMNAAGTPIKKTTREALNDTVPNWTVTEDTAIENFAFDEESPTEFWVQPVPSSAISIIISYAKEPTVFTAASTSIGISDIYLPAVKNYVLSKCLGMHTKGSDAQRSSQYMADFYKVLGLKFQSDTVLDQVQEE
ncbi:MAG: hypothetical protein PF440_07130 [Thiomicrorhabdus sp.]|jgi:hypothetical protein|nr:hypothetical protein [Thiomicrorhabdus sp.]